MKVKTSDLTDTALDWAVAKCLGGTTNPLAFTGENRSRISESWATCGPIIEREYIQIGGNERSNGDPHWHALRVKDDKSGCHMGYGPTPLIAAMRCFVASRLGDEVDIPEELE